MGILGSASYQQVRGVARWGDKSGIWRFYRRVWKNIFYERRDKEKKRGVLKRWKGEVIFFLKSFERVENEFEILWGNVFLGVLGVGREREKGGKDRGFGLSGRWDDIWNIP